MVVSLISGPRPTSLVVGGVEQAACASSSSTCTLPAMSAGFRSLQLADGDHVGSVSYAVPGRVTASYPRAVVSGIETVVWLSGSDLLVGVASSSAVTFVSSALASSVSSTGSGAYVSASTQGWRVSSIAPDELASAGVESVTGLTGADRVEVSGSGFAASHPPSCRFGAVAVSSQWTSAEQVWCSVPSSGSDAVPFSMTQGVQHQVSDAYTYASASSVRVLAASPARVSTSGGATVSVYGTGVSSESPVRCSIGGAEYAGVFLSSGWVECTLGGGLAAGFTEVGLSLIHISEPTRPY